MFSQWNSEKLYSFIRMAWGTWNSIAIRIKLNEEIKRITCIFIWTEQRIHRDRRKNTATTTLHVPIGIFSTIYWDYIDLSTIHLIKNASCSKCVFFQCYCCHIRVVIIIFAVIVVIRWETNVQTIMHYITSFCIILFSKPNKSEPTGFIKI